MQEVEEVVGVLARGIKANAEVSGRMALGNLFQALPQQRVAGSGFRELQLGGRGLEVILEEGGLVTVAGGVDADAEAAR